MKKAIFLDKDGTLIRDVPYNVDPAKISFEDHVIEGLIRFRRYGYLLIVISNQSGVAKGYFSMEALEDVKYDIQQKLGRVGMALDDFYFCPHYVCGIVDKYAINCDCRKPKPGMIYQASNDYNVELSQSWMIGDILHDVEAGNRAGCKTILIDNGNETEWEEGPYRNPDFTV